MYGKQNALERLHVNRITAGDLSSQFWCEKQMELRYLFGKKVTNEMTKGRELHYKMQEEVYVPLEIKPTSSSEYMYKMAYENHMQLMKLINSGICREFSVYGFLNSYKFVGKIDEMRIKGDKVHIIESKTTKNMKDSVFTKPHVVQVMLYKKMLEGMRSGSYSFTNFADAYWIKKATLSEGFLVELKRLGINDYVTVESMCKRMFEDVLMLPEISNMLEINYIERDTGKQVGTIAVDYDQATLDEEIAYTMKYWNGEREAAPVPESEKWKCNYCAFFGNQCTVWYNK